MLSYAITILEGLSEEMGGISFQAPVNGRSGWLDRPAGSRRTGWVPPLCSKASGCCKAKQAAVDPWLLGPEKTSHPLPSATSGRDLCSAACGASAWLPGPSLQRTLQVLPGGDLTRTELLRTHLRGFQSPTSRTCPCVCSGGHWGCSEPFLTCDPSQSGRIKSWSSQAP